MTTQADLWTKLPRTLHAALSTAGFARILAGVDADSINNPTALAALPLTRKSDLKDLQAAAMPFGALNATPIQGLKRLFMSPGPIYDPEGRGADWWRAAPALLAAGVVGGDVIHNCFSYHFTPAAFMVESAAQALGCPVIPAGVGQTEQQFQALAAYKPKVYAGTPSFLRILIEKAGEVGQDISHLQIALVAGEACPPSLRAWFIEHGVANVVQWYGTADLGCVAYETMRANTVDAGMVVADGVILEIVRPGTGDLCAAGEVGEIVVTLLNPDYPLIRFATGDMSKFITLATDPRPRIAGWMGRADQTTKVRGMFVHPAQVAVVVKRFPEVSKARLVVGGEMGQDTMTLKVECAQSSATWLASVADTVREVTKLRCEVFAVPPSSLPNDGKVIEDARSYA